MTLTEFLLARIAEDEATAHNARGLLGIETPWHKVPALRDRGLTRADAQHVARWQPTRVLAECEAKRRLVVLHQPDAEYPSCAGCSLYTDEHGESGPCTTRRLLALPYASRPDYDQAWRP